MRERERRRCDNGTLAGRPGAALISPARARRVPAMYSFWQLHYYPRPQCHRRECVHVVRVRVCAMEVYGSQVVFSGVGSVLGDV